MYKILRGSPTWDSPVVHEFHSNLRGRVSSTVYVGGKWVDFSAIEINRLYNLVDDDNDTYRVIFLDTDYQQLMDPSPGDGVNGSSIPLHQK